MLLLGPAAEAGWPVRGTVVNALSNMALDFVRRL